MSDTDWVAITAGPSAGKSTTINALGYKGYRTTPEVARMWMDELISRGDDPDEYTGTEPFQRLLMREQLSLEQHISKAYRWYLDRTLVDTIVYTEFFGYDVPDEYYDVARDRYDDVYVLEQLPFEDDYVRHEDEDDAKLIHEMLHDKYEQLGYDVTVVPVRPVSDRVRMITGESMGMDTPITELYENTE